MLKLLIGTNNRGKFLEIKDKMAQLHIELLSLVDFPYVIQPDEIGKTFAENAALKARSYALQTGCWTLADDSGLEVKALDGRPGVLSARYAGYDASDKENLEKLLRELDGKEDRSARFVCVMAVSDQDGHIRFLAEGTCNGIISTEPRGDNGFGYDPVFIPEMFDKTFAELTLDQKQKISHRAKAVEKIISFFSDFTDNLT